jgi:hypothetical protein
MSTKKKFVVRVVQTRQPLPSGLDLNEGGNIGTFVECLRYAGIVHVHDTDPHGLTTLCFDILPPHGIDSSTWADANARRMKTFGFNAEKAPATF